MRFIVPAVGGRNLVDYGHPHFGFELNEASKIIVQYVLLFQVGAG